MEIALKAVLFDLGTTLVKTAPVPEIFNRLLAPAGIRRPLEEIEAALKEANEHLKPEDYALSYDEFWRLYNMRILERLGVQENLESLADDIADSWWENADLELYPDVKETVRTLKGMGIKIGIVTNGFQTDIDEILSRTSLTGVFDVTVGADAVGRPKPDEKIFVYALEKLGVSPQEAIFIGDQPRIDYEGAANAGLKPLLVDRNDEIHERIRKIRDLREVLNYL